MLSCAISDSSYSSELPQRESPCTCLCYNVNRSKWSYKRLSCQGVLRPSYKKKKITLPLSDMPDQWGCWDGAKRITHANHVKWCWRLFKTVTLKFKWFKWEILLFWQFFKTPWYCSPYITKFRVHVQQKEKHPKRKSVDCEHLIP